MTLVPYINYKAYAEYISKERNLAYKCGEANIVLGAVQISSHNNPERRAFSLFLFGCRNWGSGRFTCCVSQTVTLNTGLSDSDFEGIWEVTKVMGDSKKKKTRKD